MEMKLTPLKDRKQNLKQNIEKNNSNNSYYSGFKKGVDDSFAIFEKYVNMYQRYKNNVKLLMDEQHDIWNKWVKFYEEHSNIDSSEYENKYNEWLFDHVFENITKSDSFLEF